jgi:DNA-binding transcriptional ArsR family regulator
MMVNTNRVAEIAALMGDPARAAMLMALMDGKALTAAELARAAGVTPQTASGHLARLSQADLLAVRRQGRHRYHQLASADVARMLEGIMQIAAKRPEKPRSFSTGPRDEAMRRARTCYGHFAGRLGVAISDALIAKGAVEFGDEAGLVTESGLDHLANAGIPMPPAQGSRPASSRPLCRPCLDWSERRPHIAGVVGAAICSHFMERNLVRRIEGTRALDITPGGHEALRRIFGIREI